MRRQLHHSPKEMQQIANQYMQSGEPWPATARQIAEWAIRNKLWAPRPASIIEQCAELLSRAMREEYITDPQGRTVRAKHVVPMEKNDEQLRLWADIRTATRDHMEIAFAQRRQQIVGDCRQLKVDVDSYNQNANPDRDRPIQIEFDFTYDLQEIEALAAVR